MLENNLYSEGSLYKSNVNYGFYQIFKKSHNCLIKIASEYNNILFNFIEFLKKEANNNTGWLLLTKEDKKNYKEFDFVFSFNNFFEKNKFNISKGTIEGTIEFSLNTNPFVNSIYFDVKNSNISNRFFFDLMNDFIKKNDLNN